MKYILKGITYITVTLAIVGCTPKSEKQPNNLELMNKEVEILYSELDRRMADNRLKTKPYYMKGQAIKKVVWGTFVDLPNVKFSTSDVEELKQTLINAQENNSWYNNKLKKIIIQECDSLKQTLKNDNSRIIEKVKLLEILSLTNLITSIEYNDYKFDELHITTSTKKIKEGEKFQTEIFPSGVNNFEESLIIIGKDSIWTQKSKAVFETMQYKKGINKIPATYLIKKNGYIISIPFEIEFIVE